MKPGEIVLVRFPFSDLESSKKRPALLLHEAKHSPKIILFTIAMITSKVDGFKLPGDILLQDWKKSGLLHPSVLRLAKIATLDHALIEKSLGELHGSDLKKTREVFRKIFSHWV